MFYEKGFYLTFFLLVFFTLYGCASCQFSPERKDFEIDSCFLASDCLYRNKANPDKSICSALISECSSFSKYLFCLDESHRPDISFKECWLYLNQR